jgi:uncharacterized protein YkwD
MAVGYEKLAGGVLGLLVSSTVVAGAFTLLGDPTADGGGHLNANQLNAAPTTEVAIDQADGDLQSFANEIDGARDALRVVAEPSTTTAKSAGPTTTTSTAAPSTAAPSTAPPTVAPSTDPSTTPSTTAESTAANESTAPSSSETTPEQTTTEQTTSTAAGVDARSFEQQVVALTNEARAANGCPALANNDKLHAAALGHSEDMFENDYFSHTGVDGSSMTDRIERQGYSWRRLAENIAFGHRTPSAVVDGWMNSSGHRANILNCDLAEIGVGFHNFYWTQNFGTPR